MQATQCNPANQNAEQNAFLTSLMERRGNTRLGMIAPKGDNVFEWLDGTLVADTFSAWNSGEPNNAGSENCAILFVSGGGKESGITMAVVHPSISFARGRRRSLTHSCCEATEIVG